MAEDEIRLKSTPAESADGEMADYARTHTFRSTISVRIMSFAQGVIAYENVRVLRMVSERSTLLIMCDYMPVLGEFDGLLELVTEKECVRIDRIAGFYCLMDNRYTFLMKEAV